MQEMTMLQTLLIAFIQVVMVVTFVFVVVPLTIFAERKVVGFLQQRLGSTRIAGRLVGITAIQNRLMWYMGKFPLVHYFRGLPGLAGDIAKLLFKEDIKPAKADKLVYLIAPAIAMVAAVMTYSVICFYPGALFTIPATIPFTGIEIPIIGGLAVPGTIADVNVGLLMLLGIASVGVYGIVLGAWASNSKYPLLGGLRSAAQMVSYEVPLSISLLVPVLLAGSLNFTEMMRMTTVDASPWAILPLFVGFFIYMTCGFAEVNRLPFDMAEAETELVAGFHTEYSGMRFGLFYLAEYINMSVVSALGATFFFGGPWLLPFGLHGIVQGFLPQWWLLDWIMQPHWFIFVGKIFTFLFAFIWVRGSWPRYRYDQLMDVAWKYLIPLALINLVAAALVRYFT
jgi:NADH-quinone oxidoreductase subunit H